MTFNTSGDIDPATANLTNSGLERALRMDTFLYQYVLGSQNVSSIYALEPMTHLQTPGMLPDMAGLEAVQQFSVLNQISLSSNGSGGDPYTGQNYPVNAIVRPRCRAAPIVLVPSARHARAWTSTMLAGTTKRWLTQS
jgi:hypothetical protein